MAAMMMLDQLYCTHHFPRTCRLQPSRLLMQSNLEDIPGSHDLHSGQRSSHMTGGMPGTRAEKRSTPFLPEVVKNQGCKLIQIIQPSV